MNISSDVIRSIVELVLREDCGQGDLTTLAVIPATAQVEVQAVMREAGVAAGLPVFAAVFAAVDPSLVVTPRVAEGATVAAGTTIAQIAGNARSILTGERVALNFIQRMCGIATLTARYVAAVQGTQNDAGAPRPGEIRGTDGRGAQSSLWPLRWGHAQG